MLSYNQLTSNHVPHHLVLAAALLVETESKQPHRKRSLRIALRRRQLCSDAVVSKCDRCLTMRFARECCSIKSGEGAGKPTHCLSTLALLASLANCALNLMTAFLTSHPQIKSEIFDPPLKRAKPTVPGYWTVEELCEETGYSRRKIGYHISGREDTGAPPQLYAIKHGGSFLVPEADALAYLEKHLSCSTKRRTKLNKN